MSDYNLRSISQQLIDSLNQKLSSTFFGMYGPFYKLVWNVHLVPFDELNKKMGEYDYMHYASQYKAQTRKFGKILDIQVKMLVLDELIIMVFDDLKKSANELTFFNRDQLRSLESNDVPLLYECIVISCG